MKLIPLLFLIVIFTVSHASAGLDEELILYLTFDNVKGKQILDVSGNDLDAKIVQNANVVRGKHGDAIKITSNTEDCVNIPASEALKISEITMSAWIYRENWAAGSGYWFDKGTYAGPADQHAYGMAVFQGRDVQRHLGRKNNGTILQMTLGGQGNQWSISSTLPRTGKKIWHHVVGTYDGTSMKIYLDGEVLLDSASFVGIDPFKVVAETNNEDLRIGCAKDQEQFAFDNGLIDEVALWSRALTQSEIRTVMNGNFLAVSPRDKVSTIWGNIKRKLW